MPDPSMINAYLQRRGAPMNADNANRVREHFFANPDQLDRAAMGLPPGLEDRAPPTLDMMLDKVIADSMPAAAASTAEAPAPSKPGPYVRKQGEVGGTKGAPSRQGEYGPGPSPSRQGGYGAGASPSVADAVAQSAAVGSVGGGSSDDSSILKWLLPILGISAAVPAAENMRGRMPMQTQIPNDRTGGMLASPQGRIGTSVMPNVESVGEEMDIVRNRNDAARSGRERQIRSEVDAENDQMVRQMEEQERARRAQKRTRELGDAAKRATGRR